MNPSAELRLAPAPAEEERALLRRAREGERAALDALVSRYTDDVYAVALRVLGDPEAARDASQDAFVNALRGLRRFRGDASFRTWLLRIALNTARSHGRRVGRRREVALEAVNGQAEKGSDPAAGALARIGAEQAERAVRRLPEKQRLAVTLRIQRGLSYREIGEVTGSSEGAARVNYHLGIKRLREWLA
ncbi:MAG TPA: sigma-70 family RNA polymerase sigma factor [Longimicrobiales bacterium]|nr:sigma-70 family RNA polymerase sigma factor [Longimicrobiales bacterium]